MIRSGFLKATKNKVAVGEKLPSDAVMTDKGNYQPWIINHTCRWTVCCTLSNSLSLFLISACKKCSLLKTMFHTRPLWKCLRVEAISEIIISLHLFQVLYKYLLIF